jgi:O-antigen/teichoic acid export membrane protein
MQNNRIGEFARYSIISVLTQAVLVLCAIVASVITARVLGPDGKGLMSLALIVPSLATMLGRFGIGHAINYFSSKIEKTRLIFNCIILGGIISCILIGLTLIVIPFFKGQFFTQLEPYLLRLVILFIPFYLFNNITNGLIQGMFEIPLFNLFSIIQASANVVLLVIAVGLLNQGVTGAVLSYTSAISIAVIVSLMYLLSKIELKNAVIDWYLIGKLLKFGTKSHVGNILKDLSYRGDILIISYFLPPASVGHYVVAVSVAEVMWKLPEAVAMVLLPKVAAMSAEGAKSFTPKATRIVVIPIVLICFIILILSRPIIITFFGTEYEPSVAALTFLIPGVFSLSLWKILANDLIAQGYPTLYSITSGVALITMVVADILLVPFLGINGASIGSSVAYLFSTILIIIFYSKVTGNSFKKLILPKKTDIVFYSETISKIYVKLKEKIFSKRGR